ncbi:hypothetical protein [Vibrio barjaei]|uniref:hypothetical protein n=1 Tax=Vibrio barjaei TaxID=1676683 RepID=UPI002283877E|nr:hypothetical protein [Vibrio barjaei]MCY9870426.1 hypothetical protein [Vibrio barjaei]
MSNYIELLNAQGTANKEITRAYLMVKEIDYRTGPFKPLTEEMEKRSMLGEYIHLDYDVTFRVNSVGKNIQGDILVELYHVEPMNASELRLQVTNMYAEQYLKVLTSNYAGPSFFIEENGRLKGYLSLEKLMYINSNDRVMETLKHLFNDVIHD